jgi:hypothetical protein
MSTESEPTYEYVKGQGWIITMYITRAFEAHGHRVTLQARLPRPGERYFMESIKTDIDGVMRALIAPFNSFRFEKSEPGVLFTGGEKHISGRNYYVITCERINSK